MSKRSRKKAPAATSPPPTGLRKFALYLITILLPPVLFFFLLESGLRLADYGHPSGFFERIRGRSDLTTNQEFGFRFFPPSLVRTTQPCVLPMKKDPNSYRIFVFGGSAALGIPEPAYGITRLLEVMLYERFPTAHFEVVNAAMTAINSHVVYTIAKDCAEQDPDLFIVYLGNNEVIGPYGVGTVFGQFSPSLAMIRAGIWLKSTRTGQLLTQVIRGLRRDKPAPRKWGALAMFLENRIHAEDPRLKKVYEHFEKNLSDICALGRGAGADVILCTVGANLKDNPPFASMHRAGLDATDLERWEEFYREGSDLAEAGRPADAIERFRAAAEIDDQYADLHFLEAGCLWELGQYQEAAAAYERALQWDCLRFRADQGINGVIREVAARPSPDGASFVDAERAFRESPLTMNNVPGRELFYEHVHMNWPGTHLLAAEIYKRVVELLPQRILAQARQGLDPPSAERCKQLMALTPLDERRLLSQIYAMMGNPPFTNQIGHAAASRRRQQELQEQAAALTPEVMDGVLEAYREAVRLRPWDLYIPQKLAQLLRERGDLSGAERQWRSLLARIPTMVEWRSELGILLSAQGRSGEAIEIFRTLIRENPQSAEYRNNLGLALAQAGRTEEALEEYRQGIRLDPRFAEVYHNLGLALAKLGDVAGAIEQYEHALDVDSTFVDAHLSAAAAYDQSGRAGQALQHYRQAVTRAPTSVAAVHSYALALARRGRLDEATEQFEAALLLDSLSVEMRSNLAAAYANRSMFKQAIREYRRVLELDPQQVEARFWLAQLLSESPSGIIEAIDLLHQTIEMAPQWVAPLHRLAHILATTPNSALRDGEEAVALAQRACELTRFQSPEILQTAAAALAEDGQFEEAIRMIDRANELARQSQNRDLLQELGRQRRSYEQEVPWREEWPEHD